MGNDKKQKLVFWALTVPIVGTMSTSGAALLMRLPQNVEGITHLGYPLYFLTFLGTAKVLGSAALVCRRFRILTEWAYAGFTFDFLAASYSHFSSGDGAVKATIPFVFLALLAGSYHFWKRDVGVTANRPIH